MLFGTYSSILNVKPTQAFLQYAFIIFETEPFTKVR